MADNRGLRFLDKVVIVTGGCQGIGKGIVDVFGENGAKVAVFDIKDDIGASLNAASPGNLYYVHCDVTNEEDIKNGIDAVITKYGKLDCLVNNAGYGHRVSLEEGSLQDFRNLLDLNLVAYYGMCKLSCSLSSVRDATSAQDARKRGQHFQHQRNYLQPKTEMYSATKGGVTAMTKGLAIDEAKNGVRVNSISPGIIRTPLYDDFCRVLPEDEVKRWNSSCQMGRVGEPREIGLACMFLATDATFSTGMDLVCSGGAELGYGVKLD